MTNREFAQKDVEFKKACDMAGISATTKQASKWRAKRGAAYIVRFGLWKQPKYKASFTEEGKWRR